MSGLEPLAALGLACNIMQLLSFGGEAISLYRKIDHEGNYDPSLETYSEKAANISEDLKKHLGRTGLNLAPEDAKLEQSAKDCKDAADELSNLLQSLSMNGQSSRRKKLKAVGKTIWKKSDITQLENKLNNIKSNLDTQLLVEIFSRLNQESLKNDIIAEAKKLFDDTLEQVSSSQGVTQQHFEALREAQKCFHHQHQQSFRMIEQHVATNALHLEDDRRRRQEENDDLARQRLLGSLHFDSMNQRKNDICEAYDDTCRWIFGRGPYHGAWPNFVDWLASENQLIYWICGKPGSGKSTLTKFIASEDSPTRECLKKWRGNVQVLSHHFWLAGSEMQHNLKGFLCSLVHQILSQDKSAALDYLRSDTRGNSKLHNTDWSPAELKSLLFELTRRDGKAYFIVVDGLDEVSPTSAQNTLMQLIRQLQRTRVKLCLSSRSEGVFKTLERYPTLPMHKFIEADIAKYTRETLSEAIPGGYDAVVLEDITYRIVANADGVFLWACLVVNSLVEGFHNGDSQEILSERLKDTPKGLTDLYIKILERRKSDPKSYKKGLSQVINMMLCTTDFEWNRPEGSRHLACLNRGRISIFLLMAATNEQFLERYLNKDDHIPPEHLHQLCDDMEKSVEAWSMGLLKVTVKNKRLTENGLRTRKSYSDQLQFCNKTVGFIHRTARDFLFNEQEGLDLWTLTSASRDGLYRKLVKACIMRCQIWNLDNEDSVTQFLDSIPRVERSLGPDTESILRAIEKALDRGVLNIEESSVETKSLEFLSAASAFGFGDYVIKRVDEMRQAHRFQEEHRRWLMFNQCDNSGSGAFDLTVVGKWQARERLIQYGAFDLTVVGKWQARERLIQYCASVGTPHPPTDQPYPRPPMSSNCLLKYLVSTLKLLDQQELVNDLDHRIISEQIVKTLGMLEQDQGSIRQHSQALVELTVGWEKREDDTSSLFDQSMTTSLSFSMDDEGVYLVLRVNASYLAKAIFAYLHGDVSVPTCGIQATQTHAEALLLTVRFYENGPSDLCRTVHYAIQDHYSKLIMDCVSPMMLEKKRLPWNFDGQVREVERVIQEITYRSRKLNRTNERECEVRDNFMSGKVTKLEPLSISDGMGYYPRFPLTTGRD